jgi:hypothetical protein
MNCCLGIGKSSKTWRPARREDQKDVGLGGWLLAIAPGEDCNTGGQREKSHPAAYAKRLSRSVCVAHGA